MAVGGERRPSFTRVRTLLGWRLWSPADDACVLEESGRIVGFVGLFPPDPQGDYVPLLCITHPDAEGDLVDAMLTWACVRAGALAQARGRMIGLHVTTSTAAGADSALLAHHGFDRLEAGLVTMARSLVDLPPSPILTHGFALRSMPEPSEFANYRETYAPLFARRNPEARRALMAHPDYDPALELLAVAEDGTLAAFCECSRSRIEWQTTGRRVGEIDMLLAHPGIRRRGLGRGLLLRSLHRLRDHGAQVATLFTERANLPARALYEVLGFTITGEEAIFARTFAPE
ncbi:MAG: GNAT family N-acetyltransferase [Chloroflexia bacterium]